MGADGRHARCIVQRWPVNNESDTWNCQSQAMEVVLRRIRFGLLGVHWRGLRMLLSRRERWQ